MDDLRATASKLNDSAELLLAAYKESPGVLRAFVNALPGFGGAFDAWATATIDNIQRDRAQKLFEGLEALLWYGATYHG